MGNHDNLAGGGDRPLGEKLPDRFEVKYPDGRSFYLTNGLELHRLVLEDYDQLERRSKELDKKIIDAKCSDAFIKEVSEPLPLSPLQVTPLYLACLFNSTNSALLLLSIGADPNIVTRYKSHGRVDISPLYLAAYHNNPAVCRSLLASGATQDVAGST